MSFAKKAAPRRTRSGQGWCMPPSVRRFGEKLLAQELWCLGRDIEHSRENLLMRYGFSRHRETASDGESSTCYRLDEDQLHIALWGFGIFFGQREFGGLVLGRFGFVPYWAPIESVSLSVHWPDELPMFDRPLGPHQWRRARKLWASLLLWLAQYEKWVVESEGTGYREECVSSWLHPIVHADRMAKAWRFLGNRGWEKKAFPIPKQLKAFTFK